MKITTTLRTKFTPLASLHSKFDAKMVEFAGWKMPLIYSDQSISESVLHTRKHCSLFDVSHMLQLLITGKHAQSLLHLCSVADLKRLPVNSGTLSVFMNSNGGIVDDCIITKINDESFYVVSNAACADKDTKYLLESKQILSKEYGLKDVSIRDITDEYGLLAVQGPKAFDVVKNFTKDNIDNFSFMTTRKLSLDGIKCHVSRSGYTGEDGFEIQAPSDQISKLADAFLSYGESSEVKWAGLGARDSLRLEAGMCLYGHDLNDSTSPVEGSLSWTIGKGRREINKENPIPFFGFSHVSSQLNSSSKVTRRRVGFVVEGAPAREGCEIYNMNNEIIGTITSGGPSPCLKKNIAMGYIKTGYHKLGTSVQVMVRKKKYPAVVTKMPFVDAKYYK